jgi:hypothetical protein
VVSSTLAASNRFLRSRWTRVPRGPTARTSVTTTLWRQRSRTSAPFQRRTSSSAGRRVKGSRRSTVTVSVSSESPKDGLPRIRVQPARRPRVDRVACSARSFHSKSSQTDRGIRPDGRARTLHRRIPRRAGRARQGRVALAGCGVIATRESRPPIAPYGARVRALCFGCERAPSSDFADLYLEDRRSSESNLPACEATGACGRPDESESEMPASRSDHGLITSAVPLYHRRPNRMKPPIGLLRFTSPTSSWHRGRGATAATSRTARSRARPAAPRNS